MGGQPFLPCRTREGIRCDGREGAEGDNTTDNVCRGGGDVDKTPLSGFTRTRKSV